MAETDVLRNQVVEWAMRDPANRSRLVRDPRAAVEEVLALDIPEDTTITVLEETASSFFIVLPAAPPAGDTGPAAENYKY